MGQVALQLEGSNDDADSHLRISLQVVDILDEFFPQGLPSPTAMALAAGRCRVITRSPANDDLAETLLAV